MVNTAWSLLRRAWSRRPRNPDLRLGYGLVSLLADRPEEALRALDALARVGDPSAELGLGTAYARLRRWTESARAFRSYVRRHPGDAVAWLRLARSRMGAGRFREAAGLLNRAIRLDPLRLPPRLLLARCWHRLGNHAEAVRVLEAALTVRPGDSEVLCVLADACEQAGHFSEAIACWQRLLVQHPVSLPARLRLASVHAHLRQWEEAERVLRPALALRPEDPLLLTALGVVREARGRWRGALRLYRRAAPHLHGAHSIYYRIGRLWYAQRRWNRALQAFRRSLVELPSHGPTWFYLGGVLARLRRYPEAMKAYAAAAGGLPPQPEARYYWGEILLLLENRESARRQFLALKRSRRHFAHRLFGSLYALTDRQLPPCHQALQRRAAVKASAYIYVVLVAGAGALAALVVGLGFALLPSVRWMGWPLLFPLSLVAAIATALPVFFASVFDGRNERRFAERIRSMAWRYMMESDPFARSLSSFQNRLHFVRCVTSLFRRYRSLARVRSPFWRRAETQSQVSETMLELLTLKPEERAHAYWSKRLLPTRTARLPLTPGRALRWVAVVLALGVLSVAGACLWSPLAWLVAACQALGVFLLVTGANPSPDAEIAAKASVFADLAQAGRRVRTAEDLAAWVDRAERDIAAGRL